MAPNRGGIERVSFLLAREFLNRGHKVVALSFSDENKDDYEKLPNADYLYLKGEAKDKFTQFNNIIKDKGIDIVINQSRSLELRRLLKQSRPEGVKIISAFHNQPFSTYKKERHIKRLLKPATVRGYILKYLTILWPEIYRKERTKFDRDQLQDLIDASHKVVFLSQRFLPRVKSFMPDVDDSKLCAINNPNTFEVKELNQEKENIMLFVARLEEPQKNIKGFIDVWNLFYRKHPDWRAIIVGDGPDRKRMEKYAGRLAVKNLEFVGNQKDVAQYYSKAKILGMTSLYEGWGMVLTEAMAYGCVPVLFNTYEACEDIVEEGKTGFIVEDIDVKKMAEKCSRIAADESLRSEMSQQAKESIKKFNPDKIASQWLELFSEVS